MRGVVLCGGLGTRLHPVTKIINKHLLNIYDKPMVYYPLQKLAEAGIKDVLVVTGGYDCGDFLRLLGNGKEFGFDRINYAYQDGEGGIADALLLAEKFAAGDKITVILGDNIFEDSITEAVEQFSMMDPAGAKIFLKKVPDPQRFGCVEFDGKRIIGIEEKPTEPKTDYVVTGIYMYDSNVFNIIKTLKPSDRNELEITDVNNTYIRKEQLTYRILGGDWTDAGTFNSLLRANNLASKSNRQIV